MFDVEKNTREAAEAIGRCLNMLPHAAPYRPDAVDQRSNLFDLLRAVYMEGRIDGVRMARGVVREETSKW